MIRVLHSWHFVELLASRKETPSGLLLPDRAQSPVFDGWVVQAGPGRILSSGARYPMQAREHDRVVFPKHAWREESDGYGFVSDEDLVGILPIDERVIGAANDFALHPAGDFVLVEPDRSGRFREHESGIVEARFSLAGGEGRVALAAQELLSDYRTLQKSERYRMADAFDRQRMEYDFLDRWPKEVVRVAWEAVKKNQGETGWKELTPFYWAEWGTTGVVRSVGPGKVGPDGRRLRDPYLQAGTRVHWDKAHRAILLAHEGETLLAVPSAHIAAEEIPGGRQEWEAWEVIPPHWVPVPEGELFPPGGIAHWTVCRGKHRRYSEPDTRTAEELREWIETHRRCPLLSPEEEALCAARMAKHDAYVEAHWLQQQAEMAASPTRMLTVAYTCGFGHEHPAEQEAQACIDTHAPTTNTG